MPENTNSDKPTTTSGGAPQPAATSGSDAQATASGGAPGTTTAPGAAARPAATPRAAFQATATESKVRVTAFFVLVLIVVYLFTAAGVIPIFLLIDFFLRAFGFPAYSPLGYLSGRIPKSLNLSTKPVYMPPKRFSARIGFAFCVAITILHYTAVSDTILSFVLGAFAALESLVGFCAGCYVYNAWARLRGQ